MPLFLHHTHKESLGINFEPYPIRTPLFFHLTPENSTVPQLGGEGGVHTFNAIAHLNKVLNFKRSCKYSRFLSSLGAVPLAWTTGTSPVPRHYLQRLEERQPHIKQLYKQKTCRPPYCLIKKRATDGKACWVFWTVREKFSTASENSGL